MKTEAEVRRYLRMNRAMLLLSSETGDGPADLATIIQTEFSVLRWMLGEVPDPPGLRSVEMMELAAGLLAEPGDVVVRIAE